VNSAPDRILDVISQELQREPLNAQVVDYAKGVN
jgi:hypothetical protein